MANADASPTPQQISAPVRVLLGYAASNIATRLASTGFIPADQKDSLAAWLLDAVPIVLALLHAAYAAYANRKSAKVAQVQAMPDMQVVTTSQATKDAVPDVKLASATGPDMVTVAVPKPTA